jgi:hypothetical protein
MAEERKIETPAGLADKFVIYRPDQLPYQKLHLCIYMRELEEGIPEEQEGQGCAGNECGSVAYPESTCTGST